MLTGRLNLISTSIMLPSNQQRQKSKNWWKCWKIWVMRMLSETYNSIVSHCIFQAHQSMDQRKLLNTSKVWSKLSEGLNGDFIWYESFNYQRISEIEGLKCITTTSEVNTISKKKSISRFINCENNKSKLLEKASLLSNMSIKYSILENQTLLIWDMNSSEYITSGYHLYWGNETYKNSKLILIQLRANWRPGYCWFSSRAWSTLYLNNGK